MTALTWGGSGLRFFEVGVDRGVLYPPVGDGVAWSGLVSIEESPSGGQVKPYYVDGYKYLNVSSLEEYEATITAFAAPAEFDELIGVKSIAKGLFATQQSHQTFGFSYRTLIGDDEKGISSGYKLHLVYNAMAEPSARSYSTVAESAEAMQLSWGVKTLSELLSGFKPTAHMVIDSRLTPAGLLSAVEDILYGTDQSEPRLPTVLELSTMFASDGPLVYTNYAINPAAVSSGGWVGSGAVPAVPSSWITDFPGVISTGARFTLTGSNGGAGFEIDEGLVSGAVVSGRFYIQTEATLADVSIFYRPNGIASTVDEELITTSFGLDPTLVPGLYECTFTHTIQTDSSIGSVIAIFFTGGGSSLNLDLSSAIVVESEVVPTFFTGDFIDSNNNYYDWLGATNASASTLHSWN